jgi:hypothetical protein
MTGFEDFVDAVYQHYGSRWTVDRNEVARTLKQAIHGHWCWWVLVRSNRVSDSLVGVMEAALRPLLRAA